MVGLEKKCHFEKKELLFCVYVQLWSRVRLRYITWLMSQQPTTNTDVDKPYSQNSNWFKFWISKGHSFCKQCLHNLLFKKTRYSSPNLSKLARADISCQFNKTRYLCGHSLQDEYICHYNLLLIINHGFHRRISLFST